jgi:hypothetical protein
MRLDGASEAFRQLPIIRMGERLQRFDPTLPLQFDNVLVAPRRLRARLERGGVRASVDETDLARRDTFSP